jgi:hypothetical protein
MTQVLMFEYKLDVIAKHELEQEVNLQTVSLRGSGGRTEW